MNPCYFYCPHDEFAFIYTELVARRFGLDIEVKPNHRFQMIRTHIIFLPTSDHEKGPDDKDVELEENGMALSPSCGRRFFP